MSTFDYKRPKTIGEVIQLLDKYRASAKLLLGGTDLNLMLTEDLVNAHIVIDLKNIEGLDILQIKEGNLIIGAGVTFSQIIDSSMMKEKFPIIWESSRTVASMGIRNRATIVGNICSAVPSADSAPALLNREAVVVTISTQGKREIPIEDFFTRPRKTSLLENEMVMHIEIPVMEKKFGGSYIKMGRYRGEDLAQVGVATLVTEELNYKISYCAVGPKPFRVKEAENLLKGKEFSGELTQELKDIILKSVSPISDIRSSKEYREKMCIVLLERSLKASLSRMKNGEPSYGTDLL